MTAKKVLGIRKPVETSVQYECSESRKAVVTVEGEYSKLCSADPSDYCPKCYEVDTSSVVSTGDGMGKMTVRCTNYTSWNSSKEIRSTIRVEMSEVTYDLEDHPTIGSSDRNVILQWLATDESKRVEGNSFKYENKEGELVSVSGQGAIKFCRAYMSGIKTFNRYFPVIERISFWNKPPGLAVTKRSFKSGSPKFSPNVGKYDSPPITLSGFKSENYFKSKDSWSQNEDSTWIRTEQWTFTPENSNGQNGWIYKKLS